jgi:hypothetical protein
MRETVTIKLAKPLRDHSGGAITQIVLREPTFDEYLSFGDPYTVAGAADGTPFGVENMDVIRSYLKVCLVEPQDYGLLDQANARVARQVKEAILGFFQPDAQAAAASGTSQTSSPSAASGKTASPTSEG